MEHPGSRPTGVVVLNGFLTVVAGTHEDWRTASERQAFVRWYFEVRYASFFLPDIKHVMRSR